MFLQGMAPPPIPGASADTLISIGTRMSSRSRGVVTCVETSDDDTRMQGQDNERTSRRTRSASRKRGVISPGAQGPPAQRARVEDPVRYMQYIPVSCLTITIISRMVVGRVKRSLKNVCLFRADLQPGPAMGACFQGSGAIRWQRGLLTLSLSPSHPRKRRRSRKRCQREKKCYRAR